MGFQTELCIKGKLTVSKPTDVFLEIPMHALHVSPEIVTVRKRFFANITLVVRFFSMNVPVFL